MASASLRSRAMLPVGRLVLRSNRAYLRLRLNVFVAENDRRFLLGEMLLANLGYARLLPIILYAACTERQA